jgi:hypothetical protein
VIICRSCHAEAHPLQGDYYATGCDCAPLELVQFPQGEAWDAYVQAIEARNAAKARAVDEVERQFKGIIATRRQQYLDAARRDAP